MNLDGICKDWIRPLEADLAKLREERDALRLVLREVGDCAGLCDYCKRVAREALEKYGNDK